MSRISDQAPSETENGRDHYDAIIVGGGPAGATAGWFLARAGKRALILEKETFPRFHIGESLLPYNVPLFEEMGVLPALKEAGFIEKYGAQFILPDGSHKTAIVFGGGRFSDQPMSYQVERSRFDEVLLRHAGKAGVEVREGTAVKDFRIEEGKGVTVTVQNGGAPETLQAKFLIDASGTSNFTGNREGLKKIYDHHRKVAIFGHFSGVSLPATGDRRRGDILIYRMKESWFWFIPLGEDKVSVGLVIDRRAFKESGLEPEAMFDTAMERCPTLRERMKNASRVEPLRSIADFSYENRRFVSPHLVRVGDAAAFLDPVFSSGVYLAMLTAKHAAGGVETALDRGLPMSPALKRYEKRTRRYLRSYFEMIENFYRQPFFELLLQPRDHMHLPDAVIAILAGQMEGGWAVRWRLRYFFLLVKLQARFRVVDRLRIE